MKEPTRRLRPIVPVVTGLTLLISAGLTGLPRTSAALALHGTGAPSSQARPPELALIPSTTIGIPSSDVLGDGGGFTVDPKSGDMYVGGNTSPGAGFVAVLNSKGDFLRQWIVDDRNEATRGIPRLAVGPDGLIYVVPGADAETIRVFKPDGTFVRQFGQGSNVGYQVGAIEVDSNGNVYVTSIAAKSAKDLVVRFNAQGEVTGQWEPLHDHDRQLLAGNDRLRGLAVAPDGSMWIVTTDPNQFLVHLDAQGHSLAVPNLRTIVGSVDNPPVFSDIEMADGLLYITGQMNVVSGNVDGLAVMTPEGIVVNLKSGLALNGAPQVVVARNTVYLTGLQRLQTTTRRTEPLSRTHSCSVSNLKDCGSDIINTYHQFVPDNSGENSGSWASPFCGQSSHPKGRPRQIDFQTSKGWSATCRPQITEQGGPCGGRGGESGAPTGNVYIGDQKIELSENGRRPTLSYDRASDTATMDLVRPFEGSAPYGSIELEYLCTDGQYHYEQKGWITNTKVKTDPSGAVFDSRTKKPLGMASVALEFSQSQAGPFGAPPSLAMLSPQTNPELTGPDGQFGWLVDDGFWRVKASRFGYRSFTSPVYKIPPPVTGIQLKLRPDARQQSLLINPAGRVGKIRLGKRLSKGLAKGGLSIKTKGGKVVSITIHSKAFRTLEGVKLGTQEFGLVSAYPKEATKQLLRRHAKTLPRYKVKKATFTLKKGKVVGIKLAK